MSRKKKQQKKARREAKAAYQLAPGQVHIDDAIRLYGFDRDVVQSGRLADQLMRDDVFSKQGFILNQTNHGDHRYDAMVYSTNPSTFKYTQDEEVHTLALHRPDHSVAAQWMLGPGDSYQYEATAWLRNTQIACVPCEQKGCILCDNKGFYDD